MAHYGGPPANDFDAPRKVRLDSPLHSYSTYEPAEDSRSDPNVVVLKVFEDNDSAHPTSPAYSHPNLSRSDTISNASASVTTGLSHGITAEVASQKGDILTFSIDNTPLLKFANPDGGDHSVIYYYKNFVHRHLAQVHRDTLGTSLETGSLTAPDVLERQAGTFLPVGLHLVSLILFSMLVCSTLFETYACSIELSCYHNVALLARPSQASVAACLATPSLHAVPRCLRASASFPHKSILTHM